MQQEKQASKTAAKSPIRKRKDQFFVALHEPDSVRLSLLESTKTVLESMKLFRELKKIRKDKIEQKKILKKQLRSISSTISKMRAEMPYVDLPHESVEAMKKVAVRQEKTKSKQHKPTPQEVKPHPKTEVDRIESELSKIERKLASLN